MIGTSFKVCPKTILKLFLFRRSQFLIRPLLGYFFFKEFLHHEFFKSIIPKRIIIGFKSSDWWVMELFPKLHQTLQYAWSHFQIFNFLSDSKLSTEDCKRSLNILLHMSLWWIKAKFFTPAVPIALQINILRYHN